MTKYYSFLTGILVFFTGCFASLPPKISDEYLNNKTSEESTKLETIEKQIIDISNSKEELEKASKITDLKLAVMKKELSQFEAEEALLIDKQKLYVTQNDTKMQEEVKGDIEKNKKDQAAAKLKLEYMKAKQKDLKNKIEVNEAELSMKVAEKYYEQAKIGKANQDKIMGAPANEKDAKNRINVADYEKYFNDQKEYLSREQKDQAESELKLKEAEKKLKDAGVIIDII